jgi:quinol monooxygenase YgiN
MPEVVVVVLSRAVPGRVEDGLAAFSALAEVTHTEEGCLLYALHREPADPDRIVLVERWASREALDEHLGSPHLLAFRSDSHDIWAEPPLIMLLDPVPAGDPAKGLISG